MASDKETDKQDLKKEIVDALRMMKGAANKLQDLLKSID